MLFLCYRGLLDEYQGQLANYRKRLSLDHRVLVYLKFNWAHDDHSLHLLQRLGQAGRYHIEQILVSMGVDQHDCQRRHWRNINESGLHLNVSACQLSFTVLFLLESLLTNLRRAELPKRHRDARMEIEEYRMERGILRGGFQLNDIRGGF